MDDYYKDIIQPPNAINAEKAVLGGLLIDPNKIADVSGVIEKDDFYSSRHQELFDAFNYIYENGQSPDLVTIAEFMNARGTLETIGGLPYLVELADSTPSTANIGNYAKAVKDTSRQRALIQAGTKIVELGYSTALTTEQKIGEAQSTLLSMETIAGEEAAQSDSAIKSVIEEIDLRCNSNGPIGIETGFKDVDEKIGGIRNQNLLIIAARPAMGKTTLAMNIAEHNVLNNVPVLVFSAEMSRVELMERMVSSSGNLAFSRVRSGKLMDSDWPKLTVGASKLKSKPLFIDDRGGLTITQIQASARKQKQKHGIKLIIVDYLQLLSGKGQSREQEVSAISRGLKSLAKELDVPVIALSQLSRKCEERSNKRPMSSDLRDSGAIEQDADIIAFIYRDEVYNEDSDHKGIAEIIFTKARNFETGTVYLATRLDICKFDNLSHEPPPLSNNNIKGGGFSYDG